MNHRLELTDYAIMALISGMWVVATVFLFKHPDSTNFATWGVICGTMTAAYQWLFIRDQKIPDAKDL